MMRLHQGSVFLLLRPLIVLAVPIFLVNTPLWQDALHRKLDLTLSRLNSLELSFRELVHQLAFRAGNYEQK
jgi:hypothetical protein